MPGEVKRNKTASENNGENSSLWRKFKTVFQKTKPKEESPSPSTSSEFSTSQCVNRSKRKRRGLKKTKQGQGESVEVFREESPILPNELEEMKQQLANEKVLVQKLKTKLHGENVLVHHLKCELDQAKEKIDEKNAEVAVLSQFIKDMEELMMKEKQQIQRIILLQSQVDETNQHLDAEAHLVQHLKSEMDKLKEQINEKNMELSGLKRSNKKIELLAMDEAEQHQGIIMSLQAQDETNRRLDNETVLVQSLQNELDQPGEKVKERDIELAVLCQDSKFLDEAQINEKITNTLHIQERTSSFLPTLAGLVHPGASDEAFQDSAPRLIMDEHQLCEHHKMNYAILKEDYIHLKKIMNDVNADMRQVILERDTVQSENVKIVGELAAKTREAKDLQDNVLTEHKLELLTAKFQKELEDQQKQTFTNLEKHKMNYAILKERYIRLKKIMNDVNADMRQVILERDTVQSENVKIVEELAAKTREAKDLQDNVLTEHKLELLTAKIQKELEDQHKQTFTNLEKKVVHYQRECDKLKNHIWFLQTDLDLQQKNNGYLLDKIQSQHNAELTQRRVKYKKLHTHRSESAQKRKCNRPCTDALERVNVLVERVTSCEAQLANERTKAESEQQILMQKLRDTQATLSTAELSCKLFAGALLNR